LCVTHKLEEENKGDESIKSERDERCEREITLMTRPFNPAHPSVPYRSTLLTTTRAGREPEKHR
jgi:hypothetical protein